MPGEEGERNPVTYRGEAQIKLLNAMFETPTGLEGLINEKISQLTYIPRRMVLPLSIQMALELALDPKRIQLGIPLSKCWRVCFMMLMRSVGGAHLEKAEKLAEQQAMSETESEEIEQL